MKLIRAASELKPGSKKVCLAIGFFDGLHLGHQQIIRQAIADARQHNALALALTFDAHPNTIVAPNSVPQLIYSLPQKLHTIELLNPDALLLIHFDRDFSEQPGEDLIRGLARELGAIQSVCVGQNFAFGRKRSGNVALLKQLGSEMGFHVHDLAAVALGGRVISSTRIREAIRIGNLDAAGQMLGRSYSISGRVIKGDQIGRTLGFPTANLDTAGLVLPPNGVYSGIVTLENSPHPAALNIGRRPTIAGAESPLRVEAHVLDFEGDLYGREIEITVGNKLRDERKFASANELREQIALDVSEARKGF